MLIKRIIIFNDYAYVFGGASKVAIDSAVELAKRGYDVTFFSGTGPESDLLAENNIKSICLNQPDMLSDKSKLQAAIRSAWNQRAYKETIKLLRDFDKKNTLIIVHGYAKTLSTSIFSAFKKTNYEVIVTLHDYFSACPNGGFYIYPKHKNCDVEPMSLSCLKCNCDVRNYPQKLYRYVRQLFIRHNLKGNQKNMHAINVSNLSGRLMKPYIRHYFSSYDTLLNPVDVYMGEYVNITENKKYLYIGRLSQEKGIKDFCEVITELQLEGIVLGDGYLMDKLKDAYPNIEFVGWSDKKKKDEYAKQAKCLIFPSLLHETFGLTITEMLSYGIPCIMPEGCGASSLIQDGVNGYKYPMGDYNALKACVKKYEESDLTLFQYSTRNSFVRKDYSVETYIDKLLNLVEGLNNNR